MVKQAFAGEDAAGVDAVETSGELVAGPGFDAVGVASFVEAGVGGGDLGLDPRAVLVRAGHGGAGGDNFCAKPRNKIPSPSPSTAPSARERGRRRAEERELNGIEYAIGAAPFYECSNECGTFRALCFRQQKRRQVAASESLSWRGRRGSNPRSPA